MRADPLQAIHRPTGVLAPQGPQIAVHRQRLLAHAQSLVRDEATAEDLVHETLLRFLARGARANGSENAYLLGILHRVAAERRRDIARRQEREAMHARGKRATDARGSEWEQREWIQHLLLPLDALARRTVWLRYVQGYSVARIARIRGESVSCVKCRLQRSARRLRAAQILPGFARQTEAQFPATTETGDIHRLRSANPRTKP